MKHIGPFTVWYDTAVPGWVAVNDKQQHSFGNGAKGERAAVRHALRGAFPQVAAAVEHLSTHFPESASRGWAAAELLVTGGVLTPDPAETQEVARVRSQRLGRWYRLLQQADGRLACECPDYDQGGLAVVASPLANQLLCKHLLAYFLAGHLTWPLTAVTSVPLHPKRSMAGRFRGRAVTAVGPHNGHQLIHSQAAARYGNGQPVLPAHQTHYKSFVAFTQQRPFSQEKLLSWSVGR